MENYYSQTLNVHGVHDVRQRETHTAEPLIPEPSVFEFDLAIDKLKSRKSSDRVQIPTELIKERVRKIRYQNHKTITSTWNKEELLEQWKSSIILPIHKKVRNGIKEIVVTTESYHFCQLCTNSFSQV